jgi:hypothetical protein
VTAPTRLRTVYCPTCRMPHAEPACDPYPDARSAAEERGEQLAAEGRIEGVRW